MKKTIRNYPVTAPDGVTLQVFERGDHDAPLVYLVHGMFTNHHFYDDLADRLAEKYRVVCYDQRSHGLSGDPTGQTCNLKQVGNDLSTILHAVQGDNPTQKAYILGHSMGGMTIGSWVSQHADEISRYTVGLALCNTALFNVTPHTRIIGNRVPDIEFFKKIAFLPGFIPMKDNFLIRRLLKRWFIVGKEPEGYLTRSLEQAQTAAPKASRQILADSARMDFSKDIDNINVPTLVITADQDKLLDPELGDMIAERLRTTGYLHELKRFSPSGHVACVDHSDGFYNTVTQAIESAFSKK